MNEPLTEAIENAKKNLPKDWMIGIVIENGDAWVTFGDPYRNELEIESGTGLVERINCAVKQARYEEKCYE